VVGQVQNSQVRFGLDWAQCKSFVFNVWAQFGHTSNSLIRNELGSNLGCFGHNLGTVVSPKFGVDSALTPSESISWQFLEGVCPRSSILGTVMILQELRTRIVPNLCYDTSISQINNIRAMLA